MKQTKNQIQLQEMKKAGSVTVIDTATIPEDDSEPQFNAEGEEIVSTQTVSSKTRTVETITVSYRISPVESGQSK